VLAAALTLGAPQPAMLAARADDAEAGISSVDKRRLAVERRKEMLAQACVPSRPPRVPCHHRQLDAPPSGETVRRNACLA